MAIINNDEQPIEATEVSRAMLKSPPHKADNQPQSEYVHSAPEDAKPETKSGVILSVDPALVGNTTSIQAVYPNNITGKRALQERRHCSQASICQWDAIKRRLHHLQFQIQL
jgi:uncharacterized protein (DUF2342 family)